MSDDDEGMLPPAPRTFGNQDTHLEIEHKDAARPHVDRFVDGWVAAKRGERITRMKMTEVEAEDWRYGYDMAQIGRFYFTQALHSFYIKLERARKI